MIILLQKETHSSGNAGLSCSSRLTIVPSSQCSEERYPEGSVEVRGGGWNMTDRESELKLGYCCITIRSGFSGEL